MEIDLERELDFAGVAAARRFTEYSGRPALWLERGLATVRGISCGDFEASVDLAFATRVGYAGLAFRGADRDNYELCYVSPVRGEEAAQYDPVFHGSNTWQVYCGPDHLVAACVPRRGWTTLTVRAAGQRAFILLDNQEIIRVHELRHGRQEGFLGLWCYMPCHFSRLTVRPLNTGEFGTEPVSIWEISEKFADDEHMSREGTAQSWRRVIAEEDGAVCLNRYCRKEEGCESIYARTVIHSPDDREARFILGFSDGCVARVNGEAVFRGTNFWGDSDTGRISWNPATFVAPLRQGRNEVVLKVMERDPFGWGFRLSIPDPGRSLTTGGERAG